MEAQVEAYLAARRAFGFTLGISGSQLLSFARFVDGTGHCGPLTLDLIVEWATLPGARPRRDPSRRLEVVRPFARHLAALDSASAVPPPGLLGQRRPRPEHFLFSDEHIRQLIGAARRLSPEGRLRPATYATLLGLLASTGLRVSEALRLACADVDLEEALLTVRATKFRKTRLVPLHPTTAAVLCLYSHHRDYPVVRTPTARFFCSPCGAPLAYSTLRSVFRGLCRSLGWDEKQPRPRIHDLRHAFACRRLRVWYTESADVGSRLGALATYLGHAKISDTYWYLTGAPDLLAAATERFEDFAHRERGER
jgi:integrase